VSRIRVLVVDDHALFRRGLVEVLAEESDIEVVGEAVSGPKAIEGVAELVPDVVFMDLNMPGQSGIETTAYLAHRWPETKVLVLTVSEEISDLFRVLSLGALGYVLKTASPQEIVEALRQVYQGWVVISPAMAPRLLSEVGRATDLASAAATPAVKSPAPGGVESQLTFREQEVLQLVAQGLSNAEIATKLVVSENTVKTHIKNILGKLHMKNRREAVAYAARLGLTIPVEGDASHPGK